MNTEIQWKEFVMFSVSSCDVHSGRRHFSHYRSGLLPSAPFHYNDIETTNSVCLESQRFCELNSPDIHPWHFRWNPIILYEVNLACRNPLVKKCVLPNILQLGDSWEALCSGL